MVQIRNEVIMINLGPHLKLRHLQHQLIVLPLPGALQRKKKHHNNLGASMTTQENVIVGMSVGIGMSQKHVNYLVN